MKSTLLFLALFIGTTLFAQENCTSVTVPESYHTMIVELMDTVLQNYSKLNRARKITHKYTQFRKHEQEFVGINSKISHIFLMSHYPPDPVTGSGVFILKVQKFEKENGVLLSRRIIFTQSDEFDYSWR